MKRNEIYWVFFYFRWRDGAIEIQGKSSRLCHNTMSAFNVCLIILILSLNLLMPNLPLYILQILTTPLTKLIIIVSILYYLIIQIHTGNKYLEWSKICAWYVFSGRQTHIVHGRPRLRWPLFVIEFSYIHIIKKYHFL